MDGNSLQADINLGGRISQYQIHEYTHSDSFMTEKEIQLIAAWGIDHVRLAVDYLVLDNENQPIIRLSSLKRKSSNGYPSKSSAKRFV